MLQAMKNFGSANQPACTQRRCNQRANASRAKPNSPVEGNIFGSIGSGLAIEAKKRYG